MPFLQVIISKHGDPHREEMEVLELLAFLPLSNTVLSLPALSCISYSLLFFPVLWTEGQGDIRTDGRTGGTQLYKMFTEDKKERTHTRTDILFYHYIGYRRIHKYPKHPTTERI